MIKDRRDFGPMLDSRGFVRGVEIGTDRGGFAAALLKGWTKCEELWCFDTYERQPDFPHDRTPDMMMACAVLAPYVPAVRLCRAKSEDGPSMIWYQPQFVYIDAAHDYESVKRDIAVWWKAAAPGAVFAGHDYHYSFPGVVKAVDEFVRGNKLDMRLTCDAKTTPSWWVEKP